MDQFWPFDHNNFEILAMVMVMNFWPFDHDTQTVILPPPPNVKISVGHSITTDVSTQEEKVTDLFYRSTFNVHLNAVIHVVRMLRSPFTDSHASGLFCILNPQSSVAAVVMSRGRWAKSCIWGRLLFATDPPVFACVRFWLTPLFGLPWLWCGRPSWMAPSHPQIFHDIFLVVEGTFTLFEKMLYYNHCMASGKKPNGWNNSV